MTDRYAEGSSAEWAFRHHQQKVYRYLLRRTGSHHEAEELTQRVFVDAAAALSRAAPPPRSLLAWLYAVAERRLVDEIRRRAREQKALASWAQPLQQSADRSYSYGPAAASALQRSIQRLPPEQRDVVVMKVLEGRTFSEIAKSLGVGEAACKMRFSRAIRQLRAELERQGFEP